MILDRKEIIFVSTNWQCIHLKVKDKVSYIRKKCAAFINSLGQKRWKRISKIRKQICNGDY